MADPIPQEPEQGAVQEQEAMAQANPMPVEAPPVQPEQIVAEAMTPQEPAPQQPRQSNQWIIPHKYDKFGPQPKNTAEVMYDASILWDVIGSQNPVVQQLAKSLRGR